MSSSSAKAPVFYFQDGVECVDLTKTSQSIWTYVHARASISAEQSGPREHDWSTTIGFTAKHRIPLANHVIEQPGLFSNLTTTELSSIPQAKYDRNIIDLTTDNPTETAIHVVEHDDTRPSVSDDEGNYVAGAVLAVIDHRREKVVQGPVWSSKMLDPSRVTYTIRLVSGELVLHVEGIKIWTHHANLLDDYVGKAKGFRMDGGYKARMLCRRVGVLDI
jgi:hypothetical protein